MTASITTLHLVYAMLRAVGWVELLRNPSCADDGFRKSSTHPTKLGLRPGREAQAGSGTGGRSVTRNIFKPIEIEVLDRACDRYPIEDFRRSGMQLVARQRLEELRILVGASLEDRAV